MILILNNFLPFSAIYPQVYPPIRNLFAQRPRRVLVAHFVRNAGPRQTHQFGKWRVRPA